MMFMILTGSTAFSQILAFTGASRGLVEWVVSFDFSQIIIIMVMQALIVVLGTFMESVSIMMITFPIFMPIIDALGFDPIWFGLLVLINMEIGMKTPPFGLCLFVMKGVVQPGTTMMDIYRSVIPFITIDLFAMLIIMFYPPIALYLPSLMRY
jgi:TRAP-type C4-dicarboxylate transport system permease large subunit